MTEPMSGLKIPEELSQHFADANRHLRHHKGPLETVVDIGAHWGSLSLLAGRMGAGKVIAFEPEPFNFVSMVELILENELWGTVTPLPVAVTRNGGSLRKFYYGMETGTHSVVAHHPQAKEIEVLAMPFVLLLKQYAPIDYLKVDIEGAEFELFDRSPDLGYLLRQCVRFLDVEIHTLTPGLYETKTVAKAWPDPVAAKDDLVEWFREYGFDSEAHPEVVEEHGRFAFGSFNRYMERS